MLAIFIRNLFRDLRRQPLRTVLTLSGVVWGTFAVVVLLAFGDGVKKQSLKNFRGMGRGMVLAFPGQTTKPYKGFTKGRQVQITPEEVERLPQFFPGIRRISPEFIQAKRIRYKREELLNTVRAINVEFAVMRNVIPAEGRFLNEIDIAQKRRVCFLGNTITENLFKGESPVGRQVFIEGVPFLVVGTMIKKQQNSNYNGQRDEHCCFVPWTTYSALYGQKYIADFIFEPADVMQTKKMMKDVRAFLGEKNGFAPDDKDALDTWDFAEFERKFQVFFLAFNIFLAVIGSFTLLVGGVGVASIMLVVVEERIREIGVKLAVGARRRTILIQFFFESIGIVMIGGSIGFFLAALVLKALPVDKIEMYIGVPKINPMVGIVTILILLGIGSVSGLVPARRAASTNPIEALRK